MALNPIKPEKGRLLLAEPSIHEHYFHRAVILLADHGREGSVGFTLNKPVDIQLSDLVEDLSESSYSVHLGGPVSKDNLFFLHTLGTAVPEAIRIMPGLWWGGDFNVVKKLIQQNKVNESQLRFFIGYSGWEAGQLDRELEENAWVVAPTTINEIMNPRHPKMWESILRSMGKDLALLSYFPEDPQLN
jgi:putative transcriptional regulator